MSPTLSAPDPDDPLEAALALPSYDPAVNLNKSGATGKPGPRGLPPLASTPVIPEWLRDPVSSARWAIRYCAHIGAFHAVRLPTYLARAVAFTPRGAARALGSLVRWAMDHEARPLRHGAVQRLHHMDYMSLDRLRKDKVKARAPIAGLLVLFVVAAAVSALSSDGPVRWFTALALVLVAGTYGRPTGDPIIPSAVVSDPTARPITLDVMSRAIIAAKLATAAEPPDFFGRVHRDGKAWSVVVDLPPGRTAAEAMARKGQLASALRVGSGRLFLRADTSDHASDARLHVRIADTDPMTGPALVSPLLKAQRTDVWKPLPFGRDERGQDVALDLMWTSCLWSGQPRTGKSFALRVLALGVALDPTTRIAVFDAKSAPDWRDFQLVAYRCGFDDSDQTCMLLRDTLAEFVADVTKRNNAISALPRHQAREGKLTKDLAKKMAVTLVVLEECQDYFANPTYGREIEALAVKLAKKGPSAGYIVAFSTQRPDAQSVPTPIRDQFALRFALRLATTEATTMALGKGAAERGFDPTSLSPTYVGVGYAVGVGLPRGYDQGGTIVRTHLVDGEQAEQILVRARKLRDEAGLLTGMAAGEEPVTWSLVDDIAAVFGPTDDDLWSQEIIARLVDRFPGRYDNFNAVTFGHAAKAVGLETVQLTRREHGKAINKWGLRLEQLTERFLGSDDPDATAADSGTASG
jgi:S-DNA-T family DNA segregation ATPase FtsK/SpoIIIE